jgi:hypothetical protein
MPSKRFLLSPIDEEPYLTDPRKIGVEGSDHGEQSQGLWLNPRGMRLREGGTEIHNSHLSGASLSADLGYRHQEDLIEVRDTGFFEAR